MGGSAFGGTLSAPVWHDYMASASNGYCEDFPAPKTPVQFHPFFGKYSTNGSSSGYSSSGSTSTTPPTTTTPSTGGGYNPQYYAPGAGQSPAPSPPTGGQGGGPGN